MQSVYPDHDGGCDQFSSQAEAGGGEVAADVEGEGREGAVGKSAECGADAAQKTRDI